MFLTQHTKQLRDWYAEDEKQEMKILDDEHKLFLYDSLMESTENNFEVIVTHYKDNKYIKSTGHIHLLTNDELRLVDQSGDIHRIKINNMLDVQA